MFLFLPCTKSLPCTQFDELPMKGAQMYPPDHTTLAKLDQVRYQITSGNFTLIPQYLSSHLELRAVLKRTQANHPGFSYDPIISDAVIETKSIPIDEALEIDYLMASYQYCQFQLQMSLPAISEIRASMLKNEKQKEAVLFTAIGNLKAGLKVLINIKQNAQTLIPILLTGGTSNIAELKPLFFTFFLTWYQINLNLLYYELQTDLQKKQQIMYGLFLKSSQLQAFEKPRLAQYAIISKMYFTMMGYYATIQNHLVMVKKQEYGNQSNIVYYLAFSIVITEIIQLSNDIVAINSLIQEQIIDEDYLDAAKIIGSQIAVPFAQSQLKAYMNVVKKIPQIEANPLIFQSKGELDIVNIIQ